MTRRFFLLLLLPALLVLLAPPSSVHAQPTSVAAEIENLEYTNKIHQ